MYKMCKVFDATDMPEDVKDNIYDRELNNHSYISHYVSPETFEDGEPNEDYSIVDKFMIEQCGCVPDEKVIILCWW